MSDKKQQIAQQFHANRQAALKNLLENPIDYVVGQADALGISYDKAAALVAFGMAAAIRNIALQALEREEKASAPTTDPLPE